MDRATLDDVQIEYEVHGAGEPVLFIHPGIFTDWFTPLFREPAVASRYRLVHYHRVGCAGSSHVPGRVTLSRHTRDAQRLLRHLGIPRAHVVGHSSSGNIALQLALDGPDVVQSLAILEPALMTVPAAATSRVFVGKALEQYRNGDPSGAIDMFLSGTCGPGYGEAINRSLPGALSRYAADAATFFEQELPALQQWSFGRDEAARVVQPVLAVVGEKSLKMDPIWGERHQFLLDLLPDVEPFVLPDATHLLQIMNPRGMASGLSAYWSRHPFHV
jgi:pimeloyl-ACP methyl ester carboxylesterase